MLKYVLCIFYKPCQVILISSGATDMGQEISRLE